MPFCAKCGNSTSDDSYFCQNCGQSLSNKIDTRIVSAEEHVLKRNESFIKNHEVNFSHIKRNLVVGLVLVMIGTCVFLLLPGKGRGANFDANKSNAQEIANWLTNQGYCNAMREFSSATDWDKKMAKEKLQLICDDDGKRYSSRTGLNPEYILIWGVQFSISTGEGRNWADGNPRTSPTQLNMISGDNWIIEVSSDETGYPGSYEDAMRIMKDISESLNGKLNANYQPYDRCTSLSEYIFARQSMDSKYTVSVSDKAELGECRKYFPKAFEINIWGK